MTAAVDHDVAPQNLEAEESVLGALLLAGWHGVGEKTLPRVLAEGLEPGHFYRPSHAAIFSAMLSLAERNGSIDPLCVERELERQGALEAAGGTSRVRELAHSASATANAPHYARLVVDSAARREEIAAIKEWHAAALSGRDLSPELIARIRALIDRLETASWVASGRLVDGASFILGDPPETPTMSATKRTCIGTRKDTGQPCQSTVVAADGYCGLHGERGVALQPLNLAEFLAGDPPETSDGEELPHAA